MSTWRRLAVGVALVGSVVLAGTGLRGPAAHGQAGEQGDPLTLDFPRLGMWWPNPWEQPLEDIARYDWVIMGYGPESVEPLRALNPDIILLNEDNACEVSFNPDDDAEPWENELVKQIPAEWFLTQVGSTLLEPVDTTATRFRVADVTASDGDKTYELFVPGDAVLIEGETVLVEEVDAAQRVLTVQRGYVRPAAAHAAGTRLAAHITFWPGSWLVNVSLLGPKATIDPAYGPEWFSDAHARWMLDRLRSAAWDGFLIDRSDPNQSWLIDNSTARTIDPDQSNTLLTDYSAFDQSWNEGLRRYESLLREAVGPDTIIFVNLGMANYDLLNGNNYEGFPPDVDPDYPHEYSRWWQDVVFGPSSVPEAGSYFDWMARARQPNLTMIETYEEDGGPDPWSDGAYDNPCEDPGFVPNYRKMRFGLATALLHDGFFSYEINTNGHGSLCLLWFDEYDNAGAGRGYLGQPLGPAVQAVPPLDGPNLLGDSAFEDSLGPWDVWADDGYEAYARHDTTTAAQGNGSLRVDVTQVQGTFWSVSAEVAPVPVVQDTEYTLSFWARTDSPRTVHLWVQQTRDPWEDYVSYGEIPLTTDWQYYELVAMASGSDAHAAFYVGLGHAVGTVWLDDVRLQAGSRQVWRRDYEGGISLVNATAASQTVDLGGTYQKINGTQDRSVNDGTLVTSVTLAPHDGVILLRP